MTANATPRRTVLLAAALLPASAATACGADGGDGGDGGTGTGAPATGGTATSAPATTGSAGTVLARTSEIPVGGGKVVADRKVVVTQPAAGEFKAFSAVCTHQGCLVDKVVDGSVRCPCHGSRFRIADGSVAAGPATRPLPEERVTVSGGTIILA
ncbi:MULTISPECIES: Rieske (2Fe-2S) protein [unclassified Streptomyces]|uniref:Rieske (2Fe-2S) protein n=1 Tax=unclassified Streptomyces TaxID=2593676 RepID=UPI0036CB0C45